jgi:putative Mn2+ efflux pump MntP
VTLTDVFVLALALAADAVTVGATIGLGHSSPRQVFRISFHFGLFQVLFPLLGILAGMALLGFVKEWGHWIAAVLLFLIGIRMVLDGLRSDKEEQNPKDPTRGLTMVALSAAVSIDALAAGVSLAAAKAPLVLAVTIIGVLTGVATMLSMMLAARISRFVSNRWNAVAGVVLLLLGVKVLYEHFSSGV